LQVCNHSIPLRVVLSISSDNPEDKPMATTV